MAHLGLSSHALVNAPNVDAPQKEEGAVVETQKLEFFRELVRKGIVPGDIIAMKANNQLGLIFHWMVDRIPPQTRNKLMNVFQSTESVYPRKIFCLLLEQMPVWTDDVTPSHSWTEESHMNKMVMERMERLKRRASYPIEFPPNMEKSVAPDNQITAPLYQYSLEWDQCHIRLTLP